MVAGYWNKPEETARALPGGALHTGDVGYMDEAGWFYIVDRKKDQINAGGYKVWPREVEDVLYEHEAVREAAVVGCPTQYRGETVKAFVSLRPGRTRRAEDELIAFCKERMAAYKYPRHDRVPRRDPEDGHRQAAAPRAARPRAFLTEASRRERRGAASLARCRSLESPGARRHAMAPERRRLLVAFGIALLLGVPFAGAYLAAARTASDLVATAALSALLFLDVLVPGLRAGHGAAFAGAPAEVLRTPDPPAHPGAARSSSLWAAILRGGSDGPLLAVVFAAVALVAAAVLPRIDQLVASRLGAGGAAGARGVGGGALLDGAGGRLRGALHPARRDRATPGCSSPAPTPPQFLDYLYFAVSVATTFGTTDVNVTNRVLRRTVTGQAVLAFAFNTVILALVLAVLSP